MLSQAAPPANMISVKVRQIFGTTSACLCKLRLTTEEQYDTADPVKVKVTPNTFCNVEPEEMVLLGPWAEESNAVRVEL